MEVQLYYFFDFGARWGWWSTPRHGRFNTPPMGKTRYPLYRRLGRPQGRSGRVLKISPPPGINPWTDQPVASRYTELLYPGPQTAYINAWKSNGKGKGKAVPLQAWSGPEGSRKLRFPYFVTTAQDGGKIVSLRQRPPLPPRKYSWYSFLLEAESTPGFYVNENSTDTSWDRTCDLLICSTLPNHSATAVPTN